MHKEIVYQDYAPQVITQLSTCGELSQKSPIAP